MKDKNTKRVVPKVLVMRPGELTPLIQVYLNQNPTVTLTDLQKRGLKLALRECAGKRFAHLVEDAA